MKDDAPYEKIILDKNTKSEIRIYDGNDDPNFLNKKRIGIYLFINNQFIASEWIECGKLVKNILVNDPKMTNKRKMQLTNKAIDNMKIVWKHSKIKWDDLCEN